LKKTVSLFIILLFLPFFGCKNHIENNTFDVLTSFYPIYIITLNVMDGAQNTALTNMASQSTGCLHDYSLTVTDMRKISSCDVFVINGGGMESFKNTQNIKTITATEDLSLLSDEHGVNAHAWLSPVNAAKMADTIAIELSALNPDNKDVYMANAKKFGDSLKGIFTPLKNQLDKISNKNIVTFHEAFPYFAKDLGLNILTSMEQEPGVEPSARDLTSLIETIQKGNVQALFSEPNASSNVPKLVSRETGKKLYALNPLTSGEMKKEAYIDIMEKNYQTIGEAFSIDTRVR